MAKQVNIITSEKLTKGDLVTLSALQCRNARIAHFFENAKALLFKKGSDYASDENPYQNMMTGEEIGISMEKFCFLRMSEKMARIRNFFKRDLLVKDETIEDTLLDLANYTAFLYDIVSERKRIEQTSKTE